MVCPSLLDELRRVLNRPKFRRYVSRDRSTRFLAALTRSAEHHDDLTATPSVSRDPEDDYLIALARTARADALVSGDKDLTHLMLLDLVIQTPRQLLDELTGLPQAGSAEG